VIKAKIKFAIASDCDDGDPRIREICEHQEIAIENIERAHEHQRLFPYDTSTSIPPYSFHFMLTSISSTAHGDDDDDDDNNGKSYNINHFVRHVGRNMLVYPQTHLFVDNTDDNKSLRGYGSYTLLISFHPILNVLFRLTHKG